MKTLAEVIIWGSIGVGALLCIGNWGILFTRCVTRRWSSFLPPIGPIPLGWGLSLLGAFPSWHWGLLLVFADPFVLLLVVGLPEALVQQVLRLMKRRRLRRTSPTHQGTIIDPADWRAAIEESLTDISEADFQQRVWIEGRGPEVSSYVEVMCDFFDMCNPNGFMDEHWQEMGLSKRQFEALRAFERALDEYRPPCGDYDTQAILDDPAWTKIRELARLTRNEVFPRKLERKRRGGGPSTLVAGPTTIRELTRLALTHLAATPEEQVAWLKTIGTYPCADELALDLDDTANAFMAGIPKGELHETLAALQDHLNGMSGPSPIWDAANLHDSRWQRARELAARALDLLSSPPPREPS